MIDFKALEEAFAPIQDVGRQEIPIKVEDHQVVLAPLLPSEETATQGFARAWVDARADENGEIPKHIATEYMNVLRVEMLCYSIVQVDGLDLRDVDYVTTGQKTDSGRSVRVQKHVALRDLITKKTPWSRPMLEIAFAKYGELMERVETDANDLVKYEPSDLTTEYDRAKKRVTDIETEMERRAKGDPNLFAEQVEAIQQYDEANKNARQASRNPPPAAEEQPAARRHATPPAPEITPLEREPTQFEPEPALEPELPPPPADPVEQEWAEFDEMPSPADLKDNRPPEPSGPVTSLREEPRQSITPPSSSPPTGEGPPRPAPPAPPTGPPTGPPVGPPIPPLVAPLDDVMDSFSDPEDPGVMEAEQNRILSARRAMSAQRHAEQSGGSAPVRRPPPPHQRGVREEAVSLDATQVGHVGDAPAFRLPAMELSARGRGRGRGRANPDDADDENAGAKSRNPHFVPAKR